MDGTRDRLPEPTPESWRRGEGIRRVAAGPSWSGIPRHAALAAAAPAAAADVIIGYVPDPAPSEPRPAELNKLILELSKHVSSAAPVSSSRARRTGERSLAIFSVLGALAAVVIVAIGILFALRPNAEVQSTPVAAAAVIETPELSTSALAAVTVHLRVGAGLPTAERQRIQATLAKAGYSSVVVQQMPFSISRSRVGYFREADRAAAQALIAALRGTNEIAELRDYSKLMSVPEPGRLDLWIRS